MVEAAVGDKHVCVRKRDGTVHCWGENAAGQLGDHYGPRRSPTLIQKLDDVQQIAASRDATCVRRRDGGTWCWGGTMRPPRQSGVDTRKPSPVPGIGPAVQLRAAGNGMCALLVKGGIVCFRDRAGFRAIPRSEDAVDFAFASAMGTRFGCLLRNDGKVACWRETDTAVAPTLVKGLDDAQMIAAGYAHACALQRNGQVVCWGNNEAGQTGRAPSGVSWVPVPVRW